MCADLVIFLFKRNLRIKSKIRNSDKSLGVTALLYRLGLPFVCK